MITLPCTLTLPTAGGTEANNSIQLTAVDIDLVGKVATFTLSHGNTTANVFTKSAILPTIVAVLNMNNGVVTLQGTQVATVVSNIDLSTLGGILHNMEFLIEDWLVEKGYLAGRMS